MCLVRLLPVLAAVRNAGVLLQVAFESGPVQRQRRARIVHEQQSARTGLRRIPRSQATERCKGRLRHCRGLVRTMLATARVSAFCRQHQRCQTTATYAPGYDVPAPHLSVPCTRYQFSRDKGALIHVSMCTTCKFAMVMTYLAPHTFIVFCVSAAVTAYEVLMLWAVLRLSQHSLVVRNWPGLCRGGSEAPTRSRTSQAEACTTKSTCIVHLLM